MLNVVNKSIMLCVIMLSVVMLNVMLSIAAPLNLHLEWNYFKKGLVFSENIGLG
jgi:hypothetical protein